MDGSSLPAVHFALQNGSHRVLLCDPSALASYHPSTDDFRFVTCHRCVAARREDTDNMKAEIQRRMNSK